MGWMLVTVELWLEVMEAEGDSGGEVTQAVEVGAREDVSKGEGDPAAAGTLVSGLPRLWSSGVGVTWPSLLVEANSAGEESVLLSSFFRAGLVAPASSLESVEVFLGG